VLTIWENVTVNLDYHVEYEKHWYSAPYVLVHVELEARVTANTVELYHRGNRVASHARQHIRMLSQFTSHKSPMGGMFVSRPVTARRAARPV